MLDGIARIVEVYGATWNYLDVQAYGAGGARHYRELGEKARSERRNPGSHERIARDFEKVARDPRTINNGLAQEIMNKGLAPVNGENRRDWVRFVLEEDCPGDADKAGGPPAVMVDFTKLLVDTPPNGFDAYDGISPASGQTSGLSRRRCWSG